MKKIVDDCDAIPPCSIERRLNEARPDAAALIDERPANTFTYCPYSNSTDHRIIFIDSCVVLCPGNRINPLTVRVITGSAFESRDKETRKHADLSRQTSILFAD